MSITNIIPRSLLRNVSKTLFGVHIRDYHDFFIVDILQAAYKGQKPIRLVTIKTNATMPRIIDATPVILPFK